MRNPFRATALVAAAVFLLAAGEAPKPDFGFLTETEQDITHSNAAADAHHALLANEPLQDVAADIPEPALGLVLPDAGSLNELVADLRDVDSGQMDENMRCLAGAVYYESKGEPLAGQLAVAQVILNRVEDGRFGHDICAVVKAPKQFGFVKAGSFAMPAQSVNWETARAIALIAIANGWPEIVPDATHFHATRVNPGWKLRRIATVGQHVFYR